MASDYANAPDLADTSDRQAALRRYHILDTKPEKDFDRITSLVAKVCDVSTALITLIDEERQWFKSCFNFDARETDIGVSFCVHAVHQGEMLVVEDATEDPRFKDNPIVTGPPHIRFYAGAPLTTPEGIHIGTLCIIDYEPQPFDAAQREILDRLSDVVVSQFELRSAEAQVRQLVDQNPQPMYVYAQSDGRLLRANAAARELYGYDDVSSLTTADLAAPAERQPSSEALSMHRRADGSFVPVRLREREVLYDGRAAVLAVPQSVSKRHDTDTTVFFRTDLEGTTQSLSAEWTAATGFDLGDTVGGPLLDFVHPLDRSSAAEVFSSLLDGDIDTCRHEVTFLTDDGTQAFELHARLVRGADGAPTGTAGTLTPIIEEAPGASAVPAPDASDSAPDASDSAAGEDEDEAAAEPSPDEDDPAAAETETAPDPSPDSAPAADAGAAPADAADPDSTGDAAAPPDADEAPPPANAEADAPDDAPAPDAAPPDEPAAPDNRSSGSDATDENEEATSIGGVFSSDLPSFDDAGPSSPSAPINDPTSAPTGASDPSSSDDVDASSAPDRDLDPVPFDIVAQLHAVLDDQTPAARRENVALRRSLPDDSLPVRLDPAAVRDVLDTMLTVALSHAAGHAVTVRAETDGDQLSLHVEGAAPEAGAEALRSARHLAQRMEGTLTRDDEARLVLTLPRSVTPGGDGHASILPSESIVD
jgi:PAS domain S-box-containing protein